MLINSTIVDLQIVLDTTFHRFILAKEEQWYSRESKEQCGDPDKCQTDTFQPRSRLLLVGDITKAVHNQGSESCTDTTTHLDAEGAAEGDQNAGRFNAGFPATKVNGETEHRERHRAGDAAADIGEYPGGDHQRDAVGGQLHEAPA